jgi:hypothetical protein
MAGLKSMAALAPRIAGPALGKRNMALAGLLESWEEVVGRDFGPHSVPLKIVWPKGRQDDGTLHLRVSSGMGLLLQHAEPQLLQRVNSYFGHASISRLRIIQAPPPQHKRRPRGLRHEAPTPASLKHLAERVAPISDDSLRQALHGLGTAILGEHGRAG